MGNSFFQFKQFTVDQSEAALKVCTESCIFGAYIPVENVAHLLDIGTGTGLLSLMLAQRSAAVIEAIELDEPSCNDAEKNFQHSPWKDRLHLHRGDIKRFSTKKKFDLIVCNPPFFIDHLKSPHDRTNAALHGSELKPEDLCELVNALSTDTGSFFVLLPEKELMLLAEKMSATGWQLVQQLTIYQQVTS